MYLAVLLLLTAGGTRAGKGWRPAIPYLGKHKCPLDHPPLLILSITPGEWNDEGELTSFALKVQQFALGVHYWIDLKLQNDIVVGDRIDHVQELSCRAAFVLQQDKTEAVTISLVIPCATSSAGVLPGHYMVRVDIWGGTRISAECSASGDMWSKTACRLTPRTVGWNNNFSKAHYKLQGRDDTPHASGLLALFRMCSLYRRCFLCRMCSLYGHKQAMTTHRMRQVC